MIKTDKTKLVRLGAARRQTRADQTIGMLEQIPMSRYEIAGWRSE